MTSNRRFFREKAKLDATKPNCYLLSLGDANYGLKVPLPVQVRAIHDRVIVSSDLLDHEAIAYSGQAAIELFGESLRYAYDKLIPLRSTDVPERHTLLWAWLPLILDKWSKIEIARR